MSQYDFGTIDASTKSGSALATDLNAFRSALHSTHKGSTAPSYVTAGMLWLDDSGDPTWVLKAYDGTTWITISTIDTTANSALPPLPARLGKNMTIVSTWANVPFETGWYAVLDDPSAPHDNWGVGEVKVLSDGYAYLQVYFIALDKTYDKYAVGAGWSADWRYLQIDQMAQDARYLKLAGGTLTGPLILDDDPTDALGVATKQYVDREYVSGEQAITAGGSLTLAHGLGLVPGLVTVDLVCKTADADYSVGDVIDLGGSRSTGNGSAGLTILKDATNIHVVIGSYTTPIQVQNKTTGASAFLTNANWRLIVRARP